MSELADDVTGRDAHAPRNDFVTEHLSSRRRRLLWALRVLILAAVVIGVSGTLRDALAELSQHHWRLRPGWAAAAGFYYLIGLAPMAWFWRRALVALGQHVPWRTTLRAYYFGHLGKYFPGKALVVVLRVALVRRSATSTWLVVVAVLLETLTMMAVGAFLAAVLAIVVLPLRPGLAALATGMAIIACVATLPPMARGFARTGLTHFDQRGGESSSDPAADADATVRGMTWRLWASGWLAAALSWCLLGLSLWATLRSIGVDNLPPVENMPLLVGAVSLAVVAGFLSLLPGGIVVRDALLLQLLAPTCGEANALVAAVLLRIIWLLSELAVCGILYGATRNVE